MSTQTASRPVGVDELKRAWHAVNAGEFRTGPGTGKGEATVETRVFWSCVGRESVVWAVVYGRGRGRGLFPRVWAFWRGCPT